MFNHLRFGLRGSRRLQYGGLKFEYSFNTHYFFIAHCLYVRTLAAQTVELLLSRVT